MNSDIVPSPISWRGGAALLKTRHGETLLRAGFGLRFRSIEHIRPRFAGIDLVHRKDGLVGHVIGEAVELDLACMGFPMARLTAD